MMVADLLPSSVNGGGADAGLFGRGRYKFWLLAVVVLLAFWSMFTGTVTLKWSPSNLNGIVDDIDGPTYEDLDILEMEEREKVVRHMWDVYTHVQRNQLPRFWQVAFEAAYEDLASGEPSIREAAISEIAKMSFRVIDLEPPPLQKLKVSGETNKQNTGGAKKTTSLKK